MKNKLQLMFTFMCFVVLFAVSVDAQGIGDRNRPLGRGTYKIVGKVYFPDGRPAPDIEVRADGAEMNAGSSTKTGIDGEFAISGLSAGNYTVTINRKGYQTETELVTIAGAGRGATYQLAFHLRPPGQKEGDIYSVNPVFKDVPKSALDKYKKAIEKVHANDLKAAIPLFNAAITDHPNFAVAHYELGSAYLKENDLDKAVESFVKAITIKPDYLEAKYGYGMVVFQKQNYEVAEAVFRDVLKQKSDMAEAHLYLGISLFHLKSGTASEAELKAAITARGGEKLALGHLYLGQIYIMKKQNADAIAELQKYVDLAPNAPNVDKIKAKIADLKKQS
jgi:predicted Zn-dependent protease